MGQCPTCSHSNPEGAGFCGECGRRLPTGQVCDSCNYAGNPPEATYCIQCGAPLGRPSFTRFIWSGGVAALLIAAVVLWQVGLLERWMTSVSFSVTQILPIAKPTRPLEEQATGGTGVPTAASNTSLTSTPLAQTPSRGPTQTSITASPAPTAAPTATEKRLSTCPGAPPQRVHVEGKAWVCTAYERLVVRQQPGLGNREVTRLEPGTYVTVIDGPECENSWSWWRIRTDSGVMGWVSEGGDDIDPYFICPAE